MNIYFAIYMSIVLFFGFCILVPVTTSLIKESFDLFFGIDLNLVIKKWRSR